MSRKKGAAPEKKVQKEKSGPKRFRLGNRLRASDPVAIEEGAARFERKITGHPTEEEIRRFAEIDLSLGALNVAFIGAHLKEGCQTCDPILEKYTR